MTTALTTTPDPPSTVDRPSPDPVAAAARSGRCCGCTGNRATGTPADREAMAALIEAGQFRTQVARRYGGLECDLSAVLESTPSWPRATLRPGGWR